MIDTAIILAGGRGTRMAPYDGPKCLVEVNGKPLLFHIFISLFKYGISRIVVCAGWNSRSIEIACAGLSVEIVDTGIDTPMTDRLSQVKSRVHSRAIVCYGDEVADVNIRRLERAHDLQKKWATVTVVPFQAEVGLFYLERNKPCVFSEKPVLPNYWANIGWCVMDRHVFDKMWSGESMADVLWALNDAKRLGFYRHRGDRFTVNTLADLEKAKA